MTTQNPLHAIKHWEKMGDNSLKFKEKKSSIEDKKEIKSRKRYYLGGHYQGIYFTVREMDISLLLLRKLTYEFIGNALNISKRTVEYYVKQIKLKLRCEKRNDLIKRLREIEVIHKYGANK